MERLVTRTGRVFTSHIAFREGIIWVASKERTQIDVDADILHETEEYNIAFMRSIRLMPAWSMEQMAEWRDEASPEAQAFFIMANRNAWRQVKEYCDRAAGNLKTDTERSKFYRGKGVSFTITGLMARCNKYQAISQKAEREFLLADRELEEFKAVRIPQLNAVMTTASSI